jgi:hypothetical protein
MPAQPERVIPIGKSTYETIQPFLGSGGFIFSMDVGLYPYMGNRCTVALYRALEGI